MFQHKLILHIFHNVLSVSSTNYTLPAAFCIDCITGTNWASRQGFTDVARERIREFKAATASSSAIADDGMGGKTTALVKLSVGEEAVAGTIGGLLSTWNQPFEVMRIEAQSNATKGLPPVGFVGTFKVIMKEHGVRGLFKGIVPRSGLCVAQTLFMVTVPHILKSMDLI